jgi:hypothetical protein
LENGGSAAIHFYMQTSSLGTVIIPTSNWFIKEGYAGENLLRVTSSCAVGYQLNHPTNPTSWVEIWGDGRRVGNEEWDDANLIDSDGWGQLWKIDRDYICLGGSISSRDFCSKCPVAYTSNSDKTSWIPGEVSDDIELALIITIAILITGIGLNLLNSLLGNSSPQSSLSMLNTIQLILLLPLVGAFIPKNVVNFIRGLNLTLLNFEFFDFRYSIFIFLEIPEISVAQTHPYLYLIGLESGSCFMNSFNIIGLFMIIPFIHMLIVLIYWWCAKGKSKPNWVHKFIIKLFQEMTFGAYIRFLFEIYLFVVLAGIAEIQEFHRSNASFEVSLYAAIWILAFWGLFIILSAYLWIRAFSQSYFKKMHYLIEFFKGLKISKLALLFSTTFFIRRAFFCCIVILISSNEDKFMKILIYCFCQLCYLNYFFYTRPWRFPKDNFCEWINETVYWTLCFYLFFINTESDWTTTHEFVYIGLIMVDNLFVTMVALGKSKL